MNTVNDGETTQSPVTGDTFADMPLRNRHLALTERGYEATPIQAQIIRRSSMATMS